MKHTMGHFHDFPILKLKNSFFLKSIGNAVLPRNDMRAEKLLKIITNILVHPISAETIDPLFALSFTKSFEFSKFAKHLKFGFNDVDP